MNTDKRWVQGSSNECRELDPTGTSHPWISIDKNSKFWYWDEVQMDMYGPFDTQDEALQSLLRYGESLNDGTPY